MCVKSHVQHGLTKKILPFLMVECKSIAGNPSILSQKLISKFAGFHLLQRVKGKSHAKKQGNTVTLARARKMPAEEGIWAIMRSSRHPQTMTRSFEQPSYTIFFKTEQLTSAMDISLRRPAPDVSVMSTCCKKNTKTNDVNVSLRKKCIFWRESVE